MDGGAWRATFHGVTKSDMTERLHSPRLLSVATDAPAVRDWRGRPHRPPERRCVCVRGRILKVQSVKCGTGRASEGGKLGDLWLSLGTPLGTGFMEKGLLLVPQTWVAGKRPWGEPTATHRGVCPS